MTSLFDQAIETVRNLPAERQDEIARLVLQITGATEAAVVHLTPDEIASFDESFAQAGRGEFASDAQVSAIWAKHVL